MNKSDSINEMPSILLSCLFAAELLVPEILSRKRKHLSGRGGGEEIVQLRTNWEILYLSEKINVNNTSRANGRAGSSGTGEGAQASPHPGRDS